MCVCCRCEFLTFNLLLIIRNMQAVHPQRVHAEGLCGHCGLAGHLVTGGGRHAGALDSIYSAGLCCVCVRVCVCVCVCVLCVLVYVLLRACVLFFFERNAHTRMSRVKLACLLLFTLFLDHLFFAG